MENEEILISLVDELKTLNQTQQDISYSLKILARSEMEKRLSHIFRNDEEILVYQLTDGKNTTSDISKYASIGKMTISRLWQRWEELNIVNTSGYRNPYQARYTLEHLALLLGQSQIGTKQTEIKE